MVVDQNGNYLGQAGSIQRGIDPTANQISRNSFSIVVVYRRNEPRASSGRKMYGIKSLEVLNNQRFGNSLLSHDEIRLRS